MPTQTPADTATSEPAATATPVLTPEPAGNKMKIDIKGFAFNPDKVTIKAGTTVIWTNQDSNTHTVTGADGNWGSEYLAQGETFEFTFDKPGTYAYRCNIHRVMVGEIVVE
jgi:plastocyanin